MTKWRRSRRSHQNLRSLGELHNVTTEAPSCQPRLPPRLPVFIFRAKKLPRSSGAASGLPCRVTRLVAACGLARGASRSSYVDHRRRSIYAPGVGVIPFWVSTLQRLLTERPHAERQPLARYLRASLSHIRSTNEHAILHANAADSGCQRDAVSRPTKVRLKPDTTRGFETGCAAVEMRIGNHECVEFRRAIRTRKFCF